MESTAEIPRRTAVTEAFKKVLGRVASTLSGPNISVVRSDDIARLNSGSRAPIVKVPYTNQRKKQ